MITATHWNLFYKVTMLDHNSTTQSAFTCSKLTIGTAEEGVKYVQR